MNSLSDQLGNHHIFNHTPRRIVSLVPSITELLYDLGLENQIVGITKFCVHPFHFKSTKTIIGGTKKVHYDRISTLSPDIIIANKEENTKEIVDALAHFCPVWVTDIKTIDDNYQMISDFGVVFNKRKEAQKWIDKLHYAHQDFTQYIIERPIKKVAYFIWANPYMVAGHDTYIQEMLVLNRFENVYATKEGRYPEVDLKEMCLDGDPEYVLLSSEPFPFDTTYAFEITRHSQHAIPVFVDGTFFSWYGSRLLQSFDYFKQLHSKL